MNTKLEVITDAVGKPLRVSIVYLSNLLLPFFQQCAKLNYEQSLIEEKVRYSNKPKG